jgi:hypothetical protein
MLIVAYGKCIQPSYVVPNLRNRSPQMIVSLGSGVTDKEMTGH